MFKKYIVSNIIHQQLADIRNADNFIVKLLSFKGQNELCLILVQHLHFTLLVCVQNDQNSNVKSLLADAQFDKKTSTNNYIQQTIKKSELSKNGL